MLNRDLEVVSSIIKMIKEHFGDLTVTRGNRYRFLGMNIILKNNKSIETDTKEILEEVIDIFTLADGREVNDVVISPAQKHLRDVNPGCKPLTNKMSERFHSIVAILL